VVNARSFTRLTNQKNHNVVIREAPPERCVNHGGANHNVVVREAPPERCFNHGGEKQFREPLQSYLNLIIKPCLYSSGLPGHRLHYFRLLVVAEEDAGVPFAVLIIIIENT